MTNNSAKSLNQAISSRLLREFKKYKVSKGEKYQYTMYGKGGYGRIRIKEDELQSLFNKYGVLPALSEQKSSVFKFFMDLDFVKSSGKVKVSKSGVTKIIEWCREVCENVSGKSVGIQVLRNAKGNIHIITNLPVMQKESNWLCEIIKATVVEKCGLGLSDRELKQLFDPCVGGLRVIGSVKDTLKDVYWDPEVEKKNTRIADYSIRIEKIKPYKYEWGKWANIINRQRVLPEITTHVWTEPCDSTIIHKMRVRLCDIKDLVECLSDERCDGYESWKAVGWCLYNISRRFGLNELELFGMWREWSSRSPKYSGEAECLYEWDKSVKDGYGFESLRLWAKEDNNVRYRQIITARMNVCPLDVGDVFSDVLLCDKAELLKGVQTIENELEKMGSMCQLLRDYKTIIVKAPTGCGKTFLSGKLIGGKRVLSVVSRRSMGYQHATTPSLQVKCYLECGFDEPRLACSFEQITRVDDIGKFDVLYLDELSNLLEHLRSPTMNGRRSRCWLRLTELIRDTDTVIATDATMNDACLWLLTQLRNRREMVWYENRLKNKSGVRVKIFTNGKIGWRGVGLQSSDYRLIAAIVHDIRKGRVGLVCSDSKKLLEEVYSEVVVCAGRCGVGLSKFKLITSDDGDDTMIRNIDETSRGMWVFFSPKIVYGVDIQTPYRRIYGFFRGNSISAIGMMQQLGRARRCDEVLISIHNSTNHDYKYRGVLFEEIKSEIKARVRSYTEYIGSNRHVKEMIVKKEVTDDFELLHSTCAVKDTANGIELAQDAVFSEVFYRLEWYAALFGVYKLFFLEKLLEAQGYEYRVIECGVRKRRGKHTQSFIDERVDQIRSIVFDTKRELEADLYIPESERYDNIVAKAIEVCKFLNIEDIRVLRSEGFPKELEFVWVDPKGIEKLMSAFLMVARHNVVVQREVRNIGTEFGEIENAKIKRFCLLKDLEDALGIERFEFEKIKAGKKADKWFTANRDDIISVFQFNINRKKRLGVEKCVKNKDYCEVLYRVYKTMCPKESEIISKHRVRIGDKLMWKPIINNERLSLIIELYNRLYGKYNIDSRLYRLVKMHECRLNDVYSTNYLNIKGDKSLENTVHDFQ